MMAVVRTYWLLITVMAAVLAVFITFISGYRLAPGLSIVQVGTLVLEDLPEGSGIYVDNTYSRRSVGDSSLALLPGSHSIIVSVPGLQPWTEVVEIISGTMTTERPLLIPMEIEVRAIMAADQPRARTLIAAQRLPTRTTPLAMEGGCVSVFVSANRILAMASSTPGCTPAPYLCVDGTCGETLVFTPKETLLSVFKLPGREDTLVASVGRSLFVLEVDPREPQFFAPLAPPIPAPKAAPWIETSLVVLSESQLFEIPL